MPTWDNWPIPDGGKYMDLDTWLELEEQVNQRVLARGGSGFSGGFNGGPFIAEGSRILNILPASASGVDFINNFMNVLELETANFVDHTDNAGNWQDKTGTEFDNGEVAPNWTFGDDGPHDITKLQHANIGRDLTLTPEFGGQAGRFWTRLYHIDGKINVTQASDEVVGIGTDFETDLIVGQTIQINGFDFTVIIITDDTNLTLNTTYDDQTENGFFLFVKTAGRPQEGDVANGPLLNEIFRVCNFLQWTKRISSGLTASGDARLGIGQTTVDPFHPTDPVNDLGDCDIFPTFPLQKGRAVDAYNANPFGSGGGDPNIPSANASLNITVPEDTIDGVGPCVELAGFTFVPPPGRFIFTPLASANASIGRSRSKLNIAGVHPIGHSIDWYWGTADDFTNPATGGHWHNGEGFPPNTMFLFDTTPETLLASSTTVFLGNINPPFPFPDEPEDIGPSDVPFSKGTFHTWIFNASRKVAVIKWDGSLGFKVNL